MKRFSYILLSLALLVTGCEKQPEVQGVPTTPPGNDTYTYVNAFAWNVMNDYYLWKKEISKGLNDWQDSDEPISYVEKIKYKDDKWTMVTDDYESFFGDVSGVSTSYGYDFILYPYDQSNSSRVLLCAVVTYVLPDSPASAAGLKRGDVIINVNNKDIVYNNNAYVDIVYDDMLGSSSCKLGLANGKSVSMTAVQLTENPVTVYKVIENGDKKIGYMHYTSFTAESIQPLITACKYFKEQGIKELVLDLRYNGGGLVKAEQAFISMLAPWAAVEAGEIYETEVYNEELTEYFTKEEGAEFNVSRFTTSFNFKYDDKQYTFDTSDANIGLDKIYAIVTDGSASASEALICCLKPFMPVELIGQQTYGKFCAGIIYGAEDWYDDMKEYFKDPADYTNGKKYAKNWGIYVMYSRFADRDGVTLCQPNGIPGDVKAEDDPRDGCQLGDPDETMLKVALQRAGFFSGSQNSVQRAPERQIEKPIPYKREKPGMVKLPSEVPSLNR